LCLNWGASGARGKSQNAPKKELQEGLGLGSRCPGFKLYSTSGLVRWEQLSIFGNLDDTMGLGIENGMTRGAAVTSTLPYLSPKAFQLYGWEFAEKG